MAAKVTTVVVRGNFVFIFFYDFQYKRFKQLKEHIADTYKYMRACESACI